MLISYLHLLCPFGLPRHYSSYANFHILLSNRIVFVKNGNGLKVSLDRFLHCRYNHLHIMHLSMLSCWGGRPGIGGGFELRSVFLFKCPAPGKSSWVKKVQIPHPRGIIVGQKIANSPAPASSQKCIGKKEQQK